MTHAEGRNVTLVSYVCDHDGKASGRLVLDGDGVRYEIVCECGQLIRLLGRQHYQLDVGAARRRPGPARRRRSRLMLAFSRGATPHPSPGRLDVASGASAVGAIRATP
jgi:hypothetical protein